MKLEDEQDKLKKQKTKQEIRITLQKALQEKIERIQQEHRQEQDLDLKLVHRALQDLQEEADKKKQKRVRHLFSAYYNAGWGSLLSSQSYRSQPRVEWTTASAALSAASAASEHGGNRNSWVPESESVSPDPGRGKESAF